MHTQLMKPFQMTWRTMNCHLGRDLYTKIAIFDSVATPGIPISQTHLVLHMQMHYFSYKFIEIAS